jgi:putative transposase
LLLARMGVFKIAAPTFRWWTRMRREVVKSVELSLLPLTWVKHGQLSDLFSEYACVANEILSTLNSKRPASETSLHHLTYTKLRRKSKLPAQLVCAARLDAWATRRHKVSRFRRLPVSYNVPRSGSLKQTMRGNPILGVASLNGRLGLPVAKDGAWRRFNQLLSNGWTFTEFKLLNLYMVRVTLKRVFQVAEPSSGQGVLGVDVGVGTLAAITIFSVDRIERQLYFGRDVWQVKRDLGIRRSKLQAHASRGSRRARRVLRGLRCYESNFDKTRCYQEAHRIVALAKRHSATIAMEDLKGLCNTKLSRRSNRKVKRMPYSMLRQAIQSAAWQEGIEVSLVSPRYTSQTCSRCGARGVRRGGMFKCECGFTANADRNASVNIAKLLWERNEQCAQARTRTCLVQPSQGGVAVNQPVRCHDDGQDPARSHACHHEHKPPISIGGS